MLDFVGAPLEEACLRSEDNRRYARTASYAQVTEQLYERSRFRYRNICGIWSRQFRSCDR